MKYFEVHTPYYALLKSENAQEAKENYVKHVSNIDGEDFDLKEVSRDYALAMFSRVPGEDKKLLPIGKLIEEFNAQEHEVIIIDGCLI